ncbi:TIGR02594 family protein [uncultured Dokdonia sp.]|uniref:TIGR02594 family protein n=1 Tax=uncultured Dokdonia sp. TaxID=575653 RepID=UPI00260BA412|nr:TIGR02594 family protein [uncultured Dokdonia sp.]
MMKHMKYAFSQYGIQEKKGTKNNPEVLKYFKELGYKGKQLKDETGWSSAFVNWVFKMSDAPYTGKLDAKSWLDLGMETNDPQLGDVVIFWREDKKSWKGHVGFFINRIGDEIFVLGGNQDNQVNISSYAASKLLGYRVII